MKVNTRRRENRIVPAIGPLNPHPDNPRYFTSGSGRAIYLTGSHTWGNLQDQLSPDPGVRFDCPAYLDWMVAHGFNFMRGWHWGQINQRDHPFWEPIRRNLAHTLGYAERIDLVSMLPRGDLASSGYCLANPGAEYLAYLPEGGGVSMNLSAGSGQHAVEWFDPTTGEAIRSGTIDAGTLRWLWPPFGGDAVLYLYTE